MDDLLKTKEELLAEVRGLRKALEKSNADLEQFAYVASHDLRAPLRGISNLSQWIEEDLGPHLGGESRRQMELLRGRVQRMESMIDGILDYSRAGRVRHKPERVDVGRLVHEVIEQLQARASARFELGPGMPTLTTERLPLQQVFTNLLSNALKHARREELLVRIEVRDGQSFHHFSVTDNGQGIAPHYQEKIWGPFQTLVARDKVEGSGMGLCVVKRIVESRGGQAWVESAEGEGAAFHFTWPRPEERST
jgi:light-regulated signal transduction histidine kinase (bacteriophytochrome)